MFGRDARSRSSIKVGTATNTTIIGVQDGPTEEEIRFAIRKELGPLRRILNDLSYYRVELRAPLRQQFAPLIENRIALFAGRAAELSIVTEFLHDRAGGYLAITAPAGFGKTALASSLVVAAGESLTYHFFTPIYDNGLSESFFLRDLVEQMAAWHGRDQLAPSQIEDLRALYHDFLGAQLDHPRVIVIDGLDEVRSWRLAPYLSRRLPEGLHVVVTIRDVGQDWRAQYEFPASQLRHLAMGGLDRDDVAKVLATAGEKAATLASGHTLDEVMRVSAYGADARLGGDPFYVRLLAEDAQAGTLTAGDLARQPTGLDRYLDSWWQGAKEPAGELATRDLLGTLTAAFGPVRRSELEELNRSLAAEWHADRFVDVLTGVRRFVGGNDQDGYSIVHPRLRAYMRRHMRLESYQARLLRYCSRWAKHGSPYALRHYAEHLLEAQRFEDLHRLLALENSERRNAWYEARLNAGDGAGYLADLAVAWSVLPSADPHGGSLATQYSLMEGSITSQATNLRPSDLGDLVYTQLWSEGEALSYARRQTEPNVKAAALVEVAASMDPRLRQPILSEAIQAIARVHKWHRGDVALDILPVIASLGHHQLAFMALEQVEDIRSWARTAAEMAPYLAEDELEHICEMADELDSRSWAIQFRVAAIPYFTENRRRSDMANRALEAIDQLGEQDDERFPAGSMTGRRNWVLHRPKSGLVGYCLEQQLESTLYGWKISMVHRLLELVDENREAVARDTLKVARGIDRPGVRALAQYLLVPFLSLSDREAVAKKVEGEIGSLPSEIWEPAIAELPSVLPAHLLEVVARSMVRLSRLTIIDRDERAKYIAQLPRWALDYVVAAVGDAIGGDQADLLSAVTARRAKLDSQETPLLPRIDSLIRSEPGSSQQRSDETVADDSAQVRLADHVRDATKIGDADGQALCRSALAPLLPSRRRTAAIAEAIDAVTTLRDNSDMQKAVASLLPVLTVAQIHKLIKAAAKLEEKPFASGVPRRSEVLKPLLLGLAERGAADIARQSIYDLGTEACVVTGAALAAHYENDEAMALYRDALEAALETGASYPPIRIDDMVEHLPDELLPMALSVAAQQWNDFWSAFAVASVARRANPPMLNRLEQLSGSFERELDRERVIAASATLIADVFGPDIALARVSSMSEDLCRSEGLGMLAPDLGRTRGKELVNGVRGISNERWRATAIHAIAPHVGDTYRNELGEIAGELDDADDRALALAGLASASTGDHQASIAESVLATALDSWREKRGGLLEGLNHGSSDAVQEVTAYLPSIRRESAVVEVMQLASKYGGRWQVLGRLATAISGESASSSLKVWIDAMSESSRQSRLNVLLDIAALTPLLRNHPEVALHSYQAIGLVAKWWP